MGRDGRVWAREQYRLLPVLRIGPNGLSRPLRSAGITQDKWHRRHSSLHSVPVSPSLISSGLSRDRCPLHRAIGRSIHPAVRGGVTFERKPGGGGQLGYRDLRLPDPQKDVGARGGERRNRATGKENVEP